MQFLSRIFHFCIVIACIGIFSINTVAQSGPPAINSVDHTSMPVGGRQCVNGTGFGPWQGNSTFTLNGTVLNTAVSWSDSQFCFQVPYSTPPGTATVQLTTANGTSNGLDFTLTPPPVINSITPERGAPGTQVTITGTNFGATQGNSYLQFDTTIPVVSWSDTQIVFTVPQGATPGSHTAWLHVDFVIAGADFTVPGPPPVINSVDNASMPVGGRQCVNGTAFGPWEGNSTFTLNGTVLNTAVTWSDTQFCFQVPASTPSGTATVQLATADEISNGLSFSLTPPPAINNITPGSGAAGTQVTITGTNFGGTQGNSYVQFDSTAPVISWSDTQIVFTVPQGVTPGSHTVVLHVDFVIAATDFTVTTTPLLQLSISDTPLQVNLSSPQVLDWIHWGRISTSQPDRKTGVTPHISDYTPLNSADVAANWGSVAFSWSDGDHSPLVSETLSDVQTSSANGGFQITAPADTTVKTLNLYLTVSGGTGILQASLSDGSAASITDQSVSDLDFGSKTYSIDFRAASAGQTLTVSFSAGNGGTVGLQAATLSAHLPVVAIGSPVAAQQFSVPASVPVNVSARQFDAAIADVTATGSEGTVLESSGSPLNASWAPLAAGHYLLTATATDTAGLLGASAPVELDVIGQGGTLSVQEAMPSSPVDLDSQGSADWVLWGPLNTGDSIIDNPGHILARRPGVAPLISEYKPIGNHFIRSIGFAHNLCFTGNQQSYCSGSELAVHGLGDGFEISVAADATPRTLQLYVGTLSADGKVVAFLSDGSAPVVTEVGGSGPPPPPNTAHTTLYNIQFTAATPGQTLTVRFTVNSDQGGGQVALIGATLSGAPVVPSVPPPQITSVTPTSAPTDAKITISGTNFGATQGASYVQIGDQAQVVSWSDTSIVAIVPAALPVGNTAELVVFTDHGISNTATLTVLSYKIFPATINLLVGQSRTLAARDNNGNPVTGLPWSTSDSTIISLSADDPPVITALAPGSAKVWAGDISVPVTVYAGTTLPVGIPIWSLPVGSGGSGDLNLVAAVPSDSGADILALDGNGTLSAVTEDGEIVWKVSGIPQRATTWGSGATTIERSTIIPDFFGSVLVTSPYTFTQDRGCATHITHKVSQISASGQMVDLHVFSDQRLTGITFGCSDNVIDGIYSDINTTEISIPHPSGPVFIQDNATIIAVDPSTTNAIATVILEPSTVNGVPNAGSLPSVIGKMIVAGDGNAYIPYVFLETQSNASAGTETTHTVSHLMVLRISPDGTNAKTELKTWTQDFTHTPTGGDSCSSCFQESTRGFTGGIMPQAAITNADAGVTVFAFYEATCSDHVHTDASDQITQCADGTQFSLMSSVAEDSVSLQVDHIAVTPFVPVLQREDGSYIGTAGDSNRLTAITDGGAMLWQSSIVDSAGDLVSVTPLYATAESGVVATTTVTTISHQDPLNPANQDFLTRVITTKLGMLYTLDSNGNLIGKTPDPRAAISWLGHSYSAITDSLAQIIQPITLAQASFSATTGGNPSASSVAVAGCPCLFQSSDDSVSSNTSMTASGGVGEARIAADFPALASSGSICPICDLQPPKCITIDGNQSTFVIIVGDPGLDGHNLVDLLNLAAQQRTNELQAQGHHVIACRASSAQQFIDVILHNGFIDGGIIYFGHGGPHDVTSGFTGQPLGQESILAIGEQPGAGTNLNADNVRLLAAVQNAYTGIVPAPGHPDRNIIGPNAAIVINGCSAGETIHDFLAGTDISIAQLIANQTKRGTYAYEQGIFFSHLDAAHEPHFDGRTVVNGKLVSRKVSFGLPMFVVPAGVAGHKPNIKRFRPQ